MSVVPPEHREFIKKSLRELAKDNDVDLDEIRFGELVIVATERFRSLMELSRKGPFHLASLAAEETFDDYLEYIKEQPAPIPPVPSLPAPAPPVYCPADDVVALRINGQPYETIAKELKISGGAKEAKKLFDQHFQGFDIQAVRRVLENYELCERVLFYIKVERKMKSKELVEQFPEEVLGLLQRYDRDVFNTPIAQLQRGQQDWRYYRKDVGWSIEDILRNRPRRRQAVEFPKDMVVDIVDNRLKTIKNAVKAVVPGFGE
jgi:hypothetical protein